MGVPRFDMIANQMVHGFNCAKLDPTEMEAFKKKFSKVIGWINSTAHWRTSAGLLGAIGKSILWFGFTPTKAFCDALFGGYFKGEHDPVHVLYLWLASRPRFKAKEIYPRAITSIRYYMEERPLKWSIRPGQNDLFEWEDNYTMMVRRIGKCPPIIKPVILEEIEKELPDLPVINMN